MDLSVVIPTLDGASRLRETLAAVGRASAPAAGVEAIIVDDGSVPPVETAVGGGTGGFPTRFVRLPENRGRGPACNAGIREARGRVVLILDDDMSVASNTLQGHVRLHDADRRIAVIGRIDTDPAHLGDAYGRCFAREESERHSRLRQSSDDVEFQDCLTGHFSARRELLEEVGGYNDDFSRYGFEDIELAWRLRRHGVRLTYAEELSALHRSVHVNFATACRRHGEAGAMAVLFAEAASDPEVDAILRVRGMRPREESTRFRRYLAAAHQAVRRVPRVLRGPVLRAARAGISVGEVVLSDPLLHAAYIVVRDMHYAAGVAGALER